MIIIKEIKVAKQREKHTQQNISNLWRNSIYRNNPFIFLNPLLKKKVVPKSTPSSIPLTLLFSILDVLHFLSSFFCFLSSFLLVQTLFSTWGRAVMPIYLTNMRCSTWITFFLFFLICSLFYLLILNHSQPAIEW